MWERIAEIRPADEGRRRACRERWSRLAKPLSGLGMLEEAIVDLAGASDWTLEKTLSSKCVVVFCADNGVVAEGVTQSGSEVTAIVAGNMTRGASSVCKMAEVAGAKVFPVDVGMVTEVEGVPVAKAGRGTANFAKGPAMSRQDCIRTIETGMKAALRCKEAGFGMAAPGEMGIGNTTTSSAVCSVLLKIPPAEVTGKGAGLSNEGLARKVRVIEEAIERLVPDAGDPVDVLSKVGGYDIAAMCGFFLGGALASMPVVIDGFIAAVAALAAVRLVPAVRGYLLASHRSRENGENRILAELGLRAPIDGDLALGEGTGAVALFPLLDMAYAVFAGMPTFEETAIEAYKPL